MIDVDTLTEEQERNFVDFAEKWLNDRGIQTVVHPENIFRHSYDILLDLGVWLQTNKIGENNE